MKRIGGNTTAEIYRKTVTKDTYGEQHDAWTFAVAVKGWLDLASGEAGYQNYAAKTEDSTHLFLCDWFNLPAGLTEENTQIRIGGKRYQVRLFEDPMGLHQHWEIHLKYTGDQ